MSSLSASPPRRRRPAFVGSLTTLVLTAGLGACRHDAASAPAPAAAPRPAPAIAPTPPAPPATPPAPPTPAAREPTPPKPSAVHLDVNAPGPKLYAALCAACHAPNGEGGAADHAPSLTNRTFLESAPDAFIRDAITHGRPGTSMGAYGKAVGGPLPDAAVSRLVAFLRSQGPAYGPLPPVAKADAALGAPIYAHQCKKCHGDQTARGEGVHLANPAFLASASDPFLRHAVEYGRIGTQMAGFSGILSDAQIDQVVAYVRSFASTPPAVQLMPAPTGHEPLVINPRGKDPVFKVRDDRFVSAEQVRDALKAKKRLMIADARPASDWMRVHIPGAVSVPYHDMARLDDVTKDVWVVAYCACPHHLSGEVVDTLRATGHARALVLDEGIIEWHRRGYPVVAARGVTPPVPDTSTPVVPAKPLPPAGAHP